MRRLLPLLVALSALAAGCTGDGEGGVAQQAAEVFDSGPTAEELARMPGSIEGVVHTVSLAPIANANVRLVREDVSRTTDSGGFFRFESLPTTSYLVEASAEGFETRTVVASVRNGTVLELNISLTEAVILAPHQETRELRGFISCGARIITPAGEHGADCAAADPNHRDAFEFDVLPDGKNAVLELSWDPANSPGMPQMRLIAETVGYGAMDLEIGNVTGSGYARIHVPQDVMEKYYPEGGKMRARVLMAPEAATPTAEVAAQTEFVVYTTVFYVEPGPDDFAVAGGA